LNLSIVQLLPESDPFRSQERIRFMTKVISIHRYLLKPSVTAQQFQSVIKEAEQLRLFELPGLEAYSFLQGIKGEELGCWIALWVYSSRSEWEQLWGTPSKPKSKHHYPTPWLRWEDELLVPLLIGDPDSIRFTSYEAVISSVGHKEGK
jgi:hypothetical protein